MLDRLLERTAEHLAVAMARRNEMLVVSATRYEAIVETAEILDDEETMDDLRRAAEESDDDAVDYEELRRQRTGAQA
jgi:hypothetical protein